MAAECQQNAASFQRRLRVAWAIARKRMNFEPPPGFGI
jgi:hypothetical protein